MSNNFVLSYFEKWFPEISPKEFYRSIFPLGELAEKGKMVSGKYNAIAVELFPEPKDGIQARKHIITDDLLLLDDLLESENFIILSPLSYIGKSRQSSFARFIYALAIDLDGITTEQQLSDLFFQIENGFLPRPSFVVCSGTGVHLYFHLVSPVPCFEKTVKQFSILKKALTKKIWNKYITELWEKPQIESLFQGFRLVGGITKAGERTRAFITGEKVSIEYLNSFVEEDFQMKEYRYKSKLALSEAKERFPEWYQKRIIEKKPKGTWTCKEDLFYWWKRKIEAGAIVGHRYFCIMVLSIYAKKSGISRKELEDVAFSLVEPLDKLTTDRRNRFTREDVLSALEAYNDKFFTFPIEAIVSLTQIPIEKNKRNHRKQELHLKLARANKAILKEAGEMKKEGRPDKSSIVKEWKSKNPNGRKVDCIRETGLSKSTVYKYWN